MRKTRETLLSPFREEKSAMYHCVSRVVNRDFVLGDEEREMFVQLMKKYARFSGLQVMSYCVMSNHFHVLVKVPPTSVLEQELDDEELIARASEIYSKVHVAEMRCKLKRFQKNHATKAERELRERYTKRMCDLSEFMKMLKWRFSCWFNKKHGRVGTLWESRFKSVLVEDGVAARTMSAYIDLNPVRAGMVSDPKDYRWCSYAEAVAGGKEAKTAIAEVMEGFAEGKVSRGLAAYDAQKKVGKSRSDAGMQKAQRRDGLGVEDKLKDGKLGLLEQYRMVLFEDGEQRVDDVGRVIRRGMRAEEVDELLTNGGKMSRSELLRCKVRYFTDGVVLGSRGFVDIVFEKSRESFGERRQTGARKMRGMKAGEDDTLYSMRDLRKDVYGKS